LAVKKSWISFAAIGALLGMLILLGTLQYFWLAQIGEAEHDRLQKRLQTDSQNFADDFNRELRRVYFIFQLTPEQSEARDFSEFTKRYEFWRNRTAHPQLVKNFYYVRRDSAPLRYDFSAREFKPTEETGEIKIATDKIALGMNPPSWSSIIVPDSTTILSPTYKTEASEIMMPDGKKNKTFRALVTGYLMIKLDEKVVNQMISDLMRRYFPDGEVSYNFLILNNADKSIVYQNSTFLNGDQPDVSVQLFDLTSGNFNVFVREKDDLTTEYEAQKRLEEANLPNEQNKNKQFSMTLQRMEKKVEEDKPVGAWTLNVQHRYGSLEKYIANTRRNNLAVSFGILGLLAVSLVLIFVSARRAQILAQRQMDFVSSVSHEFRTPLAVIYSAGENLADGITQEKTQVSRYGNLIKNEGRKLSQMVEQILEFAGARSGRKKYSFVETNVAEIIESALKQCEPLIHEKNFTIEKNIDENLPQISADKNVLSHAVQNLIINSIKYDDGDRFIKISARKVNRSVNIAVEDSGIGIAKEDLSKIFTPFYRAKTVVDAQIHGSGLGLSLIKQSVEAHGGKVKVESEIGNGSRFEIHLPFII
jgi:signal transduction histidine kinase